MIEKLKSRKLWMTILGGLAVGIFYPPMLPAYIKIVVPTYVGVQGAVDLAAALRKK